MSVHQYLERFHEEISITHLFPTIAIAKIPKIPVHHNRQWELMIPALLWIKSQWSQTGDQETVSCLFFPVVLGALAYSAPPRSCCYHSLSHPTEIYCSGKTLCFRHCKVNNFTRVSGLMRKGNWAFLWSERTEIPLHTNLLELCGSHCWGMSFKKQLNSYYAAYSNPTQTSVMEYYTLYIAL